ncbi:MAG: DUF58 domain-containing protein [Phycisphaerales bacterium]|jgi:uncharacterized protein (DUF58 family)|nr:DUF58 domain-containing protein [Phycisphaerales bacterium]
MIHGFGTDPAPPPESIEDLLGPRLLAAMEGLEITSKKVLAGKLHGERRSRRRGFSIDFADYRPYVAGDDLRYVDWNVYARLDALFLKLYLDEEDLSVLLLLDATPSMDWGAPAKWNFARRVAMAIGSISLASRHRLSVATWDSHGVNHLRDLRGRSRTAELGRWLLGREIAGADGGETFESGVRMLAPTRRGRGVVVILSDFLGEGDPLPAMRLLGGGGDDLHCLQILSPQELDPGACGLAGDLRLEDAEDGSTREVTVTPALLRAYRAKLDARVALVRDAARRSGGAHLAIPSDSDVESLLLDELRRGGLLR